MLREEGSLKKKEKRRRAPQAFSLKKIKVNNERKGHPFSHRVHHPPTTKNERVHVISARITPRCTRDQKRTCPRHQCHGAVAWPKYATAGMASTESSPPGWTLPAAAARGTKRMVSPAVSPSSFSTWGVESPRFADESGDTIYVSLRQLSSFTFVGELVCNSFTSMTV